MRDVEGMRRVLAGGLVAAQLSSVMSGVDLWWMRVEDLPAGWLSNDELERMGRLRFAADRRAFVAKRVLVRAVLSEYAAVQPDEWRFAAGEFGKPQAEGSLMDFSVARSGEMAVCAVTENGMAGVDVEDVRCRPEEEMPEWVLAPGELEVVRRLSGEARREAFLEFWTLKEAFVKGLGCGLSLPVERVAFEVGSEIKVNVPGGWEICAQWEFAQVNIEGRYAVAVARSEACETIAPAKE